MLTALAFVLLDDMVNHFGTLQDDLPEDFLPLADYFEKNVCSR